MKATLRFALVFGVIATAAAADEIALSPNHVLRFATVAEGRDVLGARDDFVAHLSPFDRQARLESDTSVSEEEFLQFARAQVRPWDTADVVTLRKVIASMRETLAPYPLPFPPMILLIHTTGREEGHAAYCRGHGIVLPSARLHSTRSDQSLEDLLIHELFHILSRSNPHLRQELYGIVGFRPCDDVQLPAPLRSRRITNPDAPSLGWYIRLRQPGRNVDAVPVLYSSSPRFDPHDGRGLFHYLEFRLMEVQQREGQWVPVIRNRQPVLLQPGNVPDYERQIGKNTRYIIHPEEVLAVNFVHLVRERDSLASPWVLERMKRVLSRAGRERDENP